MKLLMHEIIYHWCGIGASDDAGMVTASAIDAAPYSHPSASARWSRHRQEEEITFNTTSVQYPMAGVVAEADPGEELRHAHLLLFRNLLPAD